MILRKIIYIKIFYAQSYIDYYGKPAGVQPAKKNNDKKALLSVFIQMNSDELNCPGFTNCVNCFLIILQSIRALHIYHKLFGFHIRYYFFEKFFRC